ncbi:MAG TPA: iron ABC transporter permease [Ramlibacter sp.]|nr:iron ABC transporter permease [Ramlibacter sp.]
MTRATHPNRPVGACVAAGLLSFVLLPWYLGEDGSGLSQALAGGREWLWCAAVALVAAALAAPMRATRRQGWALLCAGAIGMLAVLGTGFIIGAKQPGMGVGGCALLAALVVLAAFGLARLGRFRGDLFVSAAVVSCAFLLALFIVYPVSKAMAGAFMDEAHQVSLAAFVARAAQERTFGLSCVVGGLRCGVAWNTLFLGVASAVTTTVLGTLLALVGARGSRRMRAPLNALALLPIITPPFVVGLGLILFFGRAGIVNQALEWAFGIEPSRWFYGWLGVWIAQTFAFTPVAYMIMRGVVQGVAPSLEEAAQTLRADRHRTFMEVTLPLLKPGLANAFLVGFIESMADFGNPIIVGGQFSVLSTEIFFAIVGAQYDQGRAATLALVLTLFALGVFVLQRWLLRKQSFTTVGGKGDAGIAMPLPDGVRKVAVMVIAPWLVFTGLLYAFAFAGGFVRTWGRDWTFTLAHFGTAFSLEWGSFGLVWAGTAWNSLFTTVKLAAVSAPLTAVFGLLLAWLLARTRFAGRGAFEFAALLAFAIPGTVLGVSYIVAFNVPPLELTGTGTIIVLCFLFRNLPVGVRAGTAAFEQLDRSLDEAALMLRASSVQALRHVVLPLLKPALVAALVYSFVRAVTTVSAVIFLVTAENELATTYIIGRVGNGDYGVALAYCTVLIVLMGAVTALIQFAVGERRLGRRSPVAVQPQPA